MPLAARLRQGLLEQDVIHADETPVQVCKKKDRKNWVFSDSPKGAKASAAVYSIIETAKANGLNPFQYLKYLFEHLPNADIQRHPSTSTTSCHGTRPSNKTVNKSSQLHRFARQSFFDAYFSDNEKRAIRLADYTPSDLALTLSCLCGS